MLSSFVCRHQVGQEGKMRKQLVLFERERPQMQSLTAVWSELTDERRRSVTALLAELMVRAAESSRAEGLAVTERERGDE